MQIISMFMVEIFFEAVVVVENSPPLGVWRLEHGGLHFPSLENWHG